MAAARMPRQIAFIIGNEGCERFSFYGMKNTLTVFMILYLYSHLPKAEAEAVSKSNYHLFVSACYFFPLLGGYIADRFWGKYRTIFWLSLLYCVGHGCLALHDLVEKMTRAPGQPANPTIFFVGLGLIAIGSGGIKPCVSAFVGDQFDESNKSLVKHVFALFYWIINFGSFFATLLIPQTLKWFGPSVAFGIPGILMAIATLVLFLGKDKYVHIAPTGKNPHSFLRVVADAAKGQKDKHPPQAVEGMRAVFRVMMIFAPIPVFWALFDQKGSTWVVQAKSMNLVVGGVEISPAQMMALNPAMVMLLVPLTNFVLYPALEKAGVKMTPLRRMTIGMFIAGFAFVIVGGFQVILDGGQKISVLWQAAPYLVITLAEVLVSTTGLEFAYSQAPSEMKGTIMSFWNLTVTVGNLITAFFTRINVFTGPMQYLFYAGLIFLAAIVFLLLSRRYVTVDYYQGSKNSEPIKKLEEAA